MITFDEAFEIANDEADESLVVLSCIDIGKQWAFSYATANGDVPPGTGFTLVAKSNGAVDYLTIPPIENILLLQKGKPMTLNSK